MSTLLAILVRSLHALLRHPFLPNMLLGVSLCCFSSRPAYPRFSRNPIYFPHDTMYMGTSNWAGMALYMFEREEEHPHLVKIHHCKRTSNLYHEFLIVEFDYPFGDRGPPGLTAPIVFERSLNTDEIVHRDLIRPNVNISKVPRSDPPSFPLDSDDYDPPIDRAIIPQHDRKVSVINENRRWRYKVCRTLTFRPHRRSSDITFSALLRTLEKYPPDYTSLSHQSFWFARTIFDYFARMFDPVVTEHRVSSLRDADGSLRTIFTIQPADPSLDEIISSFEAESAVVIEERSQPSHPARQFADMQAILIESRARKRVNEAVTDALQTAKLGVTG